MDIKLEDIEMRRDIYALISRLMITEVDEEFLEIIEKNSEMLNLLPNYKAWGKRKEFSNKILKERYYDVDFTNLSLLHLVPYETFYTRDDQMIESGAENPILEIYDALNFTVRLEEARVISGDHIGVELEFMYSLCDTMLKAFEEKDNDAIHEILLIQRGFLKDHLLNWSPMYLINMKKESRTPLYHDGAELTLQFILEDYEYLNHQLKIPLVEKI